MSQDFINPYSMNFTWNVFDCMMVLLAVSEDSCTAHPCIWAQNFNFKRLTARGTRIEGMIRVLLGIWGASCSSMSYGCGTQWQEVTSIFSGEGKSNVSALRLLRILRLTRVVRFVRVMRCLVRSSLNALFTSDFDCQCHSMK
eukprot:4013634-Amphidinium_carterae.1